MIQFANTPLKFWQLVKSSFASYPLIFKTTWQFILISALINLINTSLVDFNKYVGYAVSVLALLAIAFLYSLVLLMGDAALAGKPSDVRSVLPKAKHRYLSLLGAYVLFIFIGIILVAINYAFMVLGGLPGMNILGNILVALGILLAIFVCILLVFAIPLVILTQQQVFRCFEASVKLVWHSWWRVFAVFFITLLVIFAIWMLGVALIPSRNLLILGIWSAVFHFFSYSLMIGTTLILLHDVRLRRPDII